MSGAVRHIWGWVLVTLGVIGLILPVMPGWVFLIPGLVILGDYFPWARRLVDWGKAKAGIDGAGTNREEKDGRNRGGDRS